MPVSPGQAHGKMRAPCPPNTTEHPQKRHSVSDTMSFPWMFRGVLADTMPSIGVGPFPQLWAMFYFFSRYPPPKPPAQDSGGYRPQDHPQGKQRLPRTRPARGGCCPSDPPRSWGLSPPDLLGGPPAPWRLAPQSPSSQVGPFWLKAQGHTGHPIFFTFHSPLILTVCRHVSGARTPFSWSTWSHFNEIQNANRCQELHVTTLFHWHAYSPKRYSAWTAPRVLLATALRNLRLRRLSGPALYRGLALWHTAV